MEYKRDSLREEVNTMPRGRPTKDISRKDFEGLLSIGADQEEITAFFRFKLGSYSRATLHRWIKKEYGENENFETLKAQIGTPMLKMKVRQGLMGMVGKNAAATIFAAKNVLGYTDKVEQTVNDISESKGIIVNFADKGDSNAGNVPDSV
jgi:hypothetical protein